MFNMAEELFAPGRKHTDDERRRLALTREDQGDGDPGRGPIDLGSGRVTIRVPGTAEAPDDAAPEDGTPEDAAPPEGGAPDDAVPENGAPENQARDSAGPLATGS